MTGHAVCRVKSLIDKCSGPFRLAGGQGAAGSKPVIPTVLFRRKAVVEGNSRGILVVLRSLSVTPRWSAGERVGPGDSRWRFSRAHLSRGQRTHDCGWVGGRRDTKAAARAFEHPGPLASARAALARGARGEIDAIPMLVTLVVGRHDDVEAADVLGTLASEQHCADKIAGAVTEELPGQTDATRRRLAAALAEILGPIAHATLADLVEDLDPGVAFTASSVLRARD